MHKLAVNVTFTLMKSKKGIKNHEERGLSVMYKEYIKLEYIKVMRALDSGSLTKSQKKGALWEINLIKKNGAEN